MARPLRAALLVAAFFVLLVVCKVLLTYAYTHCPCDPVAVTHADCSPPPTCRVHVISFGNTERYVALAQECVDRAAAQLPAARVTTRVYTVADVGPLVARHAEWFRTHPRGFGHWLWKPYVIAEALAGLAEGDVLLYVDAGRAFSGNDCATMVRSAQPFSLVQDVGMTVGHVAVPAALAACRLPPGAALDRLQAIACHVAFRKCARTAAFVREWLDVCELEAPIEDHPLYPEMATHDQAVLSLLAVKYALPFNGLAPARRSAASSHRAVWPMLRRMITLWPADGGLG